jgi:hypothetical protein
MKEKTFTVGEFHHEAHKQLDKFIKRHKRVKLRLEEWWDLFNEYLEREAEEDDLASHLHEPDDDGDG